MKSSQLRQRLKPWILPIAMIGGIFMHDIIDKISFLSTYLIFAMLLITFCKVNIKEFRLTRLAWWLLSIQILGAIAIYFILLPIGEEVAQGTFMCVFCPVATAAPVITGMLGGSISRLTSFSIISNLAVAILAPVIFPLINESGDLNLYETTLTICARVAPMLILPLLLALILKKISPRAHKEITSRQSVSFYIWAIALFIVVGKAVSFVIKEPANMIFTISLIAICSGIVCCSQFYFGRKMGGKCGDKVVGGQGLGQKNTVLAVWMSLTYLNPLSSIGPASYVFWQNTINSWQLYRHNQKLKS